MALDWHQGLFLLGQFFQNGGWVLYVILWVGFILATLILERLLFRWHAYPRLKQQILSQLSGAPRVQQRSLLCDLDLALGSQFPLIKNLITLCPLVGLLGTVTGMIQVFDSLALYGTGNPRMMAAGVASATFPTMTGMAVAVAGLLFHSRLQRWAEAERYNLRIQTISTMQPQESLA